MRRAVRYDGLLPSKVPASGAPEPITPADVREIKKFVEEQRADDTPFDIVLEGETPRWPRR